VKPLLKRGVFDMSWIKENLDNCRREGERLAKKERKRLAREADATEDGSDDDDDDEESSEEESSATSDETSEEDEPEEKDKKKRKASKADDDDDGGVASSKGKVKKEKKSDKNRFPESWVAIESRGAAKIGMELPDKAKLVWKDGDRGVAKVKDVLFGIALVGSFTCPDAAAVDDVRILDMKYAKDGVTRKRTFATAVDDSFEPAKRPADWPIRGPMSSLWLVTQMQEANTTPKQRHFWWRQVLGLQSGDVGVDDHYFLSELVELALCYDQLNAGTSATLEAISRRYQLHEEINSEALKFADAGEGNYEWAEERRLFLGAPQSRASALVMPALKEHISSEVAKEAAIMKERRKAREERALLAPHAAAESGDKSGKSRGRGGRK